MRRFGSKQASAQDAKASLAIMLAGARDERLFGFTVDQLASMYRVDRREIECMLSAAQDRRRRQG